MFRRHRFGGMLAPLVVGGVLFAFAKHAHRRAHMMRHWAEGQASGEKPFDRAHFHGHWPGACEPRWQHFKHMHHWCDEAEPEQAAEQASPDVDDVKASG